MSLPIFISCLNQGRQQEKHSETLGSEIFKILPVSLIREVNERKIKDKNHTYKKKYEKKKQKCNLRL